MRYVNIYTYIHTIVFGDFIQVQHKILPGGLVLDIKDIERERNDPSDLPGAGRIEQARRE